MIAHLSGNVISIRKESVVLDVQSVGYEVFVSRPFEYRLGQDAQLWTYQHIREDAHLLYGFKEEADYEAFLWLINVKGVGPKSVMSLFTKTTTPQLVQAIEQGDVAYLKSLPGIGPKTASQMVLDLKGKMVLAEASEPENPTWASCQEALLSLGYKVGQLKEVKKALANQDLELGVMIQQALRMLANQ